MSDDSIDNQEIKDQKRNTDTGQMTIYGTLADLTTLIVSRISQNTQVSLQVIQGVVSANTKEVFNSVAF